MMSARARSAAAAFVFLVAVEANVKTSPSYPRPMHGLDVRRLTTCFGPLDEFIDKGALECLGASEDTPVGNAFEEGDAELKSDTDAQLLIKVTFRSPVKLSGFSIRGTQDDSAPNIVKLFVNKPNIGFDEAQDEQPLQAVELTPEEVEKDEKKELRFVKFQNVFTVQMFVEANAGGIEDPTKVKGIKFFGCPEQAMDMKDWKPVKG